MNTGSLRTAALLAGTSLILAGCSSAPSDGRPGPFAGANGPAAASQITRAGSTYTGETLATGANTYTMAQATVAIIAKHEASLEQKSVARQRAQAAVQKQVVAIKKATAAAAAHHPGAKAPRKLPRYIAVETVKDARTSPKADKAVMLWDTQAQDLVGNSVYDIANPPPVGATSRFETYSAEYVGAGL